MADDLGKQSITIEANANDEGHLYGSVGAPEIVSALKRNEITITADQVRLKGPLKELGLYTVKIHLGHEIEARAQGLGRADRGRAKPSRSQRRPQPSRTPARSSPAARYERVRQ